MILIDERIRDIEYKYLVEDLKQEVKRIPLSNDVYEEISGHSDIFYTKIEGIIYAAPNAPIIENNFIIGEEKVSRKYPEDVKYNICQIGKNVIGSKYADSIIKDKINIYVNQGYTKCSISVTGDNSCMTTDEGIYKTLKEHNIDVLLIKDDNIKLLNKNKSISKMTGFIGGASAVIGNEFIIFGDIDNLKKENKEKILEHLEKYNLKLKDFKGLDIVDYGGILMYN